MGYFHHPTLGHTLIDTGYSKFNMRPDGTLQKLYKPLLGPSVLSDTPLADGLARLNIALSQIETVILSHLHPDHIGGLRELPRTRVLVSRAAWQGYRKKTAIGNALQGIFADLLPTNVEPRLAFFEDYPEVSLGAKLGRGFDLTGDGAVVVVPLPGHSIGHFGVCFPASNFVYAADAQWLLSNLLEGSLPGVPLSLIVDDRRASQASVQRLRNFVAAGGEVMLCHDPMVADRDEDGEVG
ncbi:MAG: MBL fold metallo-hydrolase [Pseudomonadota bacterium]